MLSMNKNFKKLKYLNFNSLKQCFLSKIMKIILQSLLANII